MAKESIAVFIAAKEVKQKLMAVKKWFDGPVRTEQDKLAQAVVKMCIDEVSKIKPVDAAEVVRCKDCQHYRSTTDGGLNYCGHTMMGRCTKADDFCSYGVRIFPRDPNLSLAE